VAGQDPLPRLRTIRDEIRRIERLHPRRNRLIREAAEQGHTQQQIAKAAGLSQARIHQIVIRDL
jgi:DNA-directed RNA polymerase specialized sigma24 family protein